jgi:hypothetical protein
MQRARRLEQSDVAREATASRATPLTIVSGGVAGEELERVGRVAADGLGRPVVVVGTDASVVSPPGALAPLEVQAAVDAALATVMSAAPRRALLYELRAAPPADVGALVAALRKLGFDLSRGAVAVCAAVAPEVALPATALMARMADGRVLGLLEATADAPDLGTRVAVSAPRRDAALLHEALAEAELLLELPDNGDEGTYRLLIGVLLRDPEELEQLANGTIAPIAAYDERHDTELLATLECFLAHHGSTTEAAEAMNLHRHTIGYRLARAHEVSGLSPHESAGRERLSLGLKARQILEVYRRRMTRL